MPHPGPLQKLIDMCSTSHVHIDTSLLIHENGGIVFVYPPIQDKEEEEDAGRDRISTTCPPLSISTTTETTLKQQDVRAMRDNSTLLSPKMMASTATTRTTTNDEVLDEWVIV